MARYNREPRGQASNLKRFRHLFMIEIYIGGLGWRGVVKTLRLATKVALSISSTEYPPPSDCATS
ncbi:hypothetical protein SNOG_12710 [Parastagonospora nodorum SN15]|uniref:Uncharacterized protein n=1 Tax=Phaeosphaeria nodorum (strain SN15 / ATCC MYA-4574 / FGSC 10173) TaxID=321614 RepID=Q0U6A4_PHANO|nr:hypothetical protein SNOG_12710 [Parastagonospora nodorum SN15]EAT80008.1 hypothetical protein SNOG_12710 [Parastagonospora nodorum SN15]